MKKWFVVFIFMASVPLFAKEQTAAEKVSYDFTQVAKKSIPAVVFIRVESNPQAVKDERKDLHDFFEDDFFHHFFGGPRGGSPFFQRPEAKPKVGQGSGVLVSADGMILTNNHVIAEGDKITVKLNDGREFGGKVLGKDPNSDLAIVKIEASGLPYLSLGNSDQLDVGEWVIAVGNPLGLQASLTVGVVSAKGRSNLSLTNYEDFIQTDAAINFGNSGGALLNLDGDVVGINTAMASHTGGYMGIGFSIPSNSAKEVMRQLLDKGEVTRSYMGVVLQPIDHDLATAFGLEKVEGVLVAEVAPDSPAKQSGILPGDVILRYNKLPVDNLGSFRNTISLFSPGTEVALDLQREGKPLHLSVVLGQLPDVKKQTPVVESAVGFSVETLTDELRDSYGYQGEEGVVVSSVQPGSAAALSGIKKGALILAANQKKVKTVEEFYQALESTEKGGGLLLLIKQSGQTRYLYMKQ